MNTITLTDEQMKALQSGQSITIEPPKPFIQKWEPKRGKFNVLDSSLTNNILAGFSYETKEQAQKAAKALRAYSRQLAWLAENDDGWVADWNDTTNKYFIYYHDEIKKYNVGISTCWKILSNIYMSKANAEKLIQLLNDGIVEF